MRFLLLLLTITALNSLTTEVYSYQQFDTNDSIEMVLNDNELLNIDFHFELFKNYKPNNDSLLISYLQNKIVKQKALNNANKIHSPLYMLGRYYLYKHNYNEAGKLLFEAQELLGQNIQKATILYFIAQINIENNRFIEALEYLRQVQQIANVKQNTYLQAKTLLQQGNCYTELHNYAIAENHYNQAYSLIESNALRELYGEIFMHRGYLQYKQLNYLNALANFYKGLEFFDQDTIIGNYAIIHDYIGKIHYYQENYEKALSYFYDANMLYAETKNRKALGFTHHEMALSYLALGKLSECEENIINGESYFKSINYTPGLALMNLLYSKLYLKNNLKQLAQQVLYDSLTLKLEQENSISSKFTFYIDNAQFHLFNKNIDSAFIFIEKANKIENLDLINHIKIEELFAEAYNLSYNYKKAYQHKSNAAELKNKLNKQINSYDIKVLQSELELSQTKVIIEHLNEERQIQNQTIIASEARVEKQKSLLYLGLVVLLLVLLSAFLLGAFLHQKRKDNKILTARNIQIAQHKEEIEQQSQHLQEINAELEELSVIARETDNGIKIMNAVGRVLWVNEGYIKMHGYNLEELQSIGNLDLLGEQANIDIQQLVNVWYGDKQPITFESLNKTKDSKEIWVQTTLTPILDENGKIDRMIAIDSDITLIKAAEKEILIKNQDITSSISYAKRIQEAMMPPFNILKEKFKKSYVFYKPKSIVSGDFYWMTKRHDRLVIACADSTGHGVPGAFMSMIGMSFLNKIVNEKGFVSPDIILNRMRMNIINHLHQDGSETLAGDGMDMAIITIDKTNSKLEYAGAMNPIIIVRNGSLIELKPDRMPVGFFDNEDRPFTANTLNIEKGDNIFMYTDGFYDQFGGPRGSKLKTHRFKELLLKTAEQPHKDQKNYIINEFNSWKGEYPQVDDVLLISIPVD